MATTQKVPEAQASVITGDGALSKGLIEQFRNNFDANPTNRMTQNAVTRVSIDHVSLNREVIATTDHTFSHVLDDWKVTNQAQSGRCWAFAGMNLLRVGAMKKMNLKEFEFSQNYVLFWDKLERANYFLEAIIETAGQHVDDRTVAFLLSRPLDDGGQWNMFVSLVKKHGLIPKAFMPESQSSSATRRMNQILLSKLRENARDLRRQHASGASLEQLRDAKQGMLDVIHRMLFIHLGTPPRTIQWQWTDRDGEFHRDEEMTPRQFAETYIDLPIDDYVCLVHDPRETSPTGRTFTVQYLGNVIGGDRVVYLNIDVDLMKRLAADSITGGEPVWFGCDVGKMMHRQMGLWDARLYDLEPVYDTSFSLDKAARLEYHETQMTHAMLFTGVDLVDGEPRRWRVENSWGEKNGVKGFFTMNDNWFGEHVFEIAARRDALPAELQAALEQEPIVLPPWDPMGALAGEASSEYRDPAE